MDLRPCTPWGPLCFLRRRFHTSRVVSHRPPFEPGTNPHLSALAAFPLQTPWRQVCL